MSPNCQHLISRLGLSLWILYVLICGVGAESSGGAKISLEISKEFAHLVERASANNRIHLISEHVRNGQRLQVQEFLDLSSWNQLIQFKWFEGNAQYTGAKGLKSHKINVLVLNNEGSKILVQYEPYQCNSRNFSTTTGHQVDGALDWVQLVSPAFHGGQWQLHKWPTDAQPNCRVNHVPGRWKPVHDQDAARL